MELKTTEECRDAEVYQRHPQEDGEFCGEIYLLQGIDELEVCTEEKTYIFRLVEIRDNE